MFRQSCNAASLIQQAIESLHCFAAQQQVSIYLTTPASIPLKADPHYLGRALSYLLHNAIKFSPPDRQITITVSLLPQSDPHNLLHLPAALIRFLDQGAGIPETALKQIFQPFHQMHSGDDRSHSGLGLELAICQAIIQQHQGAIWVESHLGQGSAFCVLLPLAAGTESCG